MPAGTRSRFRASARFTSRTSLGAPGVRGISRAPYGPGNLGGHVGDDPAAVAHNRGLLADTLRVERARLIWMDQVHGAEVAVVDGAEPPTDGGLGPTVPDVDALVTATPGTALAVLVADCVPVLLADSSAGVVAAVHAGRRGLQLGAVPAAVERMLALGALPEQLEAWIGPAVCGRCYEVPAVMRDEVAAVAPASASTTSTGTAGLDIRAGIREQLEKLGVGQLQASSACTVEDAELFSYRRDGVTGRLAGVVWFESS